MKFLKRLIGNKSIVTIIAGIACVVILAVAYRYRVNQKINAVSVPYAKVQINSREQVTDDKIGTLGRYTYTDAVGMPISSTATAGTGYKFVGWYEDAELNGLPIKEIEADRKGNVILYAKYEQNKYKITYMSKGKDVTKEVKKLGGVDSVVYGETFPIPTLETNGNEYFSGWFLTKDYKGAASTYTPSDIETDIV